MTMIYKDDVIAGIERLRDVLREFKTVPEEAYDELDAIEAWARAQPYDDVEGNEED